MTTIDIRGDSCNIMHFTPCSATCSSDFLVLLVNTSKVNMQLGIQVMYKCSYIIIKG